jgi:hypothetical protein
LRPTCASDSLHNTDLIDTVQLKLWVFGLRVVGFFEGLFVADGLAVLLGGDGLIVGSIEGLPVGSIEGLPVGSIEGLPVGSIEGLPVGSIEGLPMAARSMEPVGAHVPETALAANILAAPLNRG